MPRYRIHWNIGYGTMGDVVEAADHEEAVDIAYQAARDDFESQASYSAEQIGDDEEDEE